MSILTRRLFWLNLAGACVTAVVAASPILMSGIMDRGFEIAKQTLVEPLATLALGAVLLSDEWRRSLRHGGALKIAVGSLAIFLLLASVSTAMSDNPEVAIFGGYYRREGLLAWCVYGAFFFAVLGWARESGRITGFLDVLLLASMVPAGYALQQRLGLDFYALGGRDFSRPGGTLGSPPFLAAYLGLLLPVTAARYWQSRPAWPDVALWSTLAVLQILGLLATQSRGPLLAGMLGMLMLACGGAAYLRMRKLFISAVAAFLLFASSVAAINTLPAARHWAQGMPVASRLVFAMERDASFTTQLASRSAATRLAVWAAGTDTLVAAPLANKLLGYGPESAYMHYFSHMPASVMSIAGYGASATYDRMHADTLDISLNFGLVAWLAYCVFFATVLYAAASALWSLSGAAPRWLYAGITCGSGALFSVAAIEAGFASAAVPAFGLGICAGILMFMVGCAWRMLAQDKPQTPATQAGRRILLAGLCASLWVFWTDAQVNIPVLTTRLISFAVAALILIIANDIAANADRDDEPARLRDAGFRHWGLAYALIAAFASCLPIATFDAVSNMHWWRRALPILLLLCGAAFAAWAYMRRNSYVQGDFAKTGFDVALGAALVYSVLQIGSVVNIADAATLADVQSLAYASIAGPLIIFVMCVIFAVRASCGVEPGSGAAAIPRLAKWSAGVVVLAVALVAAHWWRAVQADVASSLANHASASRQSQRAMIETSVRLLPYERYYRRQLVFDLLGRAVADIRMLGSAPERIPVVMQNLAAAETAARTGALLFPGDPWMVAALANVLQVEALRMLRPLDVEGGARAAQEANQLFASAHAMFPGEPLLLRNWAELHAEQGDLPGAYRLLDQMESLIPDDPEPYFARMRIAKQAFDKLAVSDTLARARRVLEPAVFNQLSVVANEQQN